MTGERSAQAPFQAQVELLQLFLAHREQIVEKIHGLLTAQQKPAQYLQDRALLSRHFEDGFFTLAAITRDQARLRGQLQQAHYASGFRPRDVPGIPNDLFDPAEMMIRAFNLWRQTRWPGRNGRVRYAQTLFNLHVVRSLALLNMRLWDVGTSGAGERLAQVQAVLEQLWKTSPADQPVLVRDARWLIPVAQSPTTDDLGPYFEVAQKVAESLSEEDRIEIHKASVLMAGGHLRSQLRHFNMQGVSLGETSLVLSSRGSNALDFAMTIQGLVPLLKVYENACQSGEQHSRRKLAGVICQAISPDPELFVNRVDLFGAYSMIEHLFVTTDNGRVVYTPTGQRHMRLLQEYAALISRMSKSLYEDCPSFKPVRGAYSPYGVLYGFSSNLIEHMAMKTLQPDAVTSFSLEDVFVDGQASADKLAWVSGWRKLPHISPEIQKLYDYPQQFAEEVFQRIEQALRKCAADGAANAAVQTGHLFIQSVDDPEAGTKATKIAELPVQYIVSSDMQIVAANKARASDQAQLLYDRNEGMHLVSYQTAGGWVAITKDILTDVLGAGRDAKIADLPGVAAAVLRLMYPALVQLVTQK